MSIYQMDSFCRNLVIITGLGITIVYFPLMQWEIAMWFLYINTNAVVVVELSDLTATNRYMETLGGREEGSNNATEDGYWYGCFYKDPNPLS